MQQYIKINSKDNVAVALLDLPSGFKADIEGDMVSLKEDIARGHKFSLKDIAKGEAVIKYGAPIGYTLNDVESGRHLHTHNLKTTLSDVISYKYEKALDALSKAEPKTFMGYRRADGKVGVRNEIWIIPTVGCVNNVAQQIATMAKGIISKNVDDVVAFPHPYGCSQMGDDQEYTRIILADLINHPNAAAVLVLGLGCENSDIEVLKKYMGEYDTDRVKFIVAQDHEDEIEASLKEIEALNKYAEGFKRESLPSSELIIGLKCGGSDGLSGITANPTVGVFSDMLIAGGGTTILTEVPEMFGAETLLMNRCKDEETFNKTVKLINDFKDYFIAHNQVIYENPSPGNKKGGISTLEDKSLGCTQKSGIAEIVDVLPYGGIVKERGLNLLSSPGNDLVASTALAAAGAHIVLFTTGRGTPFASPVPTVKISSNTPLSQKKNNWIDFNCGTVIENSKDGGPEELFDYVLRVASGEKVKTEKMGYHDMAIFKQGVTL